MKSASGEPGVPSTVCPMLPPRPNWLPPGALSPSSRTVGAWLQSRRIDSGAAIVRAAAAVAAPEPGPPKEQIIGGRSTRTGFDVVLIVANRAVAGSTILR